MLLLVPVVALAADAPLTGDLHVVGEVATAASPGDRRMGVGATLAGRPDGHRFDHGGRLNLLTGTDSPFSADLRAQSRLWLADPGAWGSVALAYGVRMDASGPRPVGDLEAAWDVPLDRPDVHHRLRVSGRLGLAGVAPESAVLAVGWAWGPPPEPPPPPPPPPPEPQGPDTSGLPDDARVWLPHPVCTWVHPDEVEASLADLPEDQAAQVRAAAYATLYTDVGGLDGATMLPARPQGALLVVGRPGDRVQLGEQQVPAGPDGVVQLAVAEGPVEVVVVGGGRSIPLSAAVSEGHGTWVRVDDPAPTAIEFGMGSHILDDAARARLALLVEHAGDWEFELQGGFSPEGNRSANIALANRRSAAVHEALLELGLPESQVRIVTAAVPEDATSAAARRVCTILPRSPGEGSP